MLNRIIEIIRSRSVSLPDEHGNVCTWLDEDEFYRVAGQILSEMQPNSDIPPQLNKHDVSGRSEQLPCGECADYAEYDGTLKYCSVCGTKL